MVMPIYMFFLKLKTTNHFTYIYDICMQNMNQENIFFCVLKCQCGCLSVFESTNISEMATLKI